MPYSTLALVQMRYSAWVFLSECAIHFSANALFHLGMNALFIPCECVNTGTLTELLAMAHFSAVVLQLCKWKSKLEMSSPLVPKTIHKAAANFVETLSLLPLPYVEQQIYGLGGQSILHYILSSSQVRKKFYEYGNLAQHVYLSILLNLTDLARCRL